jgi:hypothetical protein
VLNHGSGDDQAKRDKSTLYRLNRDEKTKNQRKVAPAEHAKLLAMLVRLFPAGVPGAEAGDDGTTVTNVDDAARRNLAGKLAARPLASPHLVSIELLRDLRGMPELKSHSATIDYVIGVLTAGDAYRPNLNLQLERDDSDAAELRSFLLHYTSNSSGVGDQGLLMTGSAPPLKRRSTSGLGLDDPDVIDHIDGDGAGRAARDAADESSELDEQRLLSAAVMASLKTWQFDVFDFAKQSGGRPLYFIGLALFRQHGLIERFRIPEDKLRHFLTAVEEGYRPNLYHNHVHAADVTQSVNFFLTTAGLGEWLTPLEIMAMLLASLTHDLDHVGFNNAFLINTDDPLALLHNDRSVLENHHIHQLFVLLRRDDCNFLCNLERAQYKELRELIIDLILSTDFSRHFALLGQFKAKHAAQNGIDIESKEDKHLLLGIALKCADVGHTAKAHELHLAWTQRITGEFFLQGDEEKRRGLSVSPFMDRETTVIAKSQTGFIEFLVLPLYELWANQFEPARECLTLVRANLAHWQKEAAAADAAAVAAGKKTSGVRRRKKRTGATSGEEKSAKLSSERSEKAAENDGATTTTSGDAASPPAATSSEGSKLSDSAKIASKSPSKKVRGKQAAVASEQSTNSAD